MSDNVINTEFSEEQLENIIPNEKRTKCTVWTRVMGYHRPTESFNHGKKGEHKERKFFILGI